MAASLASLTGLSCGVAAPLRVPEVASAAYSANYGTATEVDNAAYSSQEFWDVVEGAIPGFADDPELGRFRGFVDNLRTEAPGEIITLDNGQEILKQYFFPGLEEEDGVDRSPFPSMPEWERALEDLAATARSELVSVLMERPLDDDLSAPPADDDDVIGGVWNKAAWFGWQFLSLRDAKEWMPHTIRALRAVPTAHRFVGIARQRGECIGSLHSDQRNYLLSTLTGLRVPRDAPCGVVCPSSDESPLMPQERKMADKKAIVLDNTFPHYVYNDSPMDRFVLMAECWHPALTAKERDALATTFAAKDRFTLINLKQCPWGFSDEELMRAILTKDHFDLAFWRDLDHGL